MGSRGWHWVKGSDGKPRTPYTARFKHGGRTHTISTGESDAERASVKAAAAYAEVLAGRWRPVERGLSTSQPLDTLVAQWLVAIQPQVSQGTLRCYIQYARLWPDELAQDLSGLERALPDWTRHQLSHMTAKSHRKVRSALRGFLSWCVEKGLLPAVPAFPALGRKTVGTRTGPQRAKPVAVTQEEAEAILARLPEWSHRTVNGRRFPVRSFFQVLYETGLRPVTVLRMTVPESYTPGVRELRILDEQDKARWGRVVPITAKCQELLDSVAPERGPIFQKRHMRQYIKQAAQDAGLPEHAAKAFSQYDFRHARITHLLEQGANVLGVAYLAGHTQLTTTNMYVRVAARHGKEALDRIQKGSSSTSPGSAKDGN